MADLTGIIPPPSLLNFYTPSLGNAQQTKSTNKNENSAHVYTCAHAQFCISFSSPLFYIASNYLTTSFT